MADLKISELTPILGADTASDDEFAIVDTSTTETKNITKSELAAAIEAEGLEINSRVIGGTTPVAADFTTATVDGIYIGGSVSDNYVNTVATASTFFSKTANSVLTSDVVFDAAAEVTIAYGATITADMDTFFNGVVTMTGAATLDFTNIKTNQSGYVRFIQDATGSRVLSYSAECETAGGIPIVLTTTANAEDMLLYIAISPTRVVLSSILDIS